MSIATEISRLQTAKADLKTSIEAKGVTVPNEALIDTYDTYVDAIETGGGEPMPAWKDPNWVDIKQLYDDNFHFGTWTPAYSYRAFNLISATYDTLDLPAGFAYQLSDGTVYNDTTGHTHTWNKALDLTDSNGIKYRWISYYRNTTLTGGSGTIPNFKNTLLWAYFGIPITGRLDGATSVNNTYNF